jgi:hypothetical protein
MARPEWYTGNPTVDAAIEAAIAEQAAVVPTKTINAQVGVSYTPVLADEGQIVTLTNASAIALSLPQDSAAAFPIGSDVTLIQGGAGLVTISAGAGATVHHAQVTLKFLGEYGVVKALKVAANTWIVTGDLALS